MAETQPDLSAKLVAASRANVPEIAAALNRCLQANVVLEAADPRFAAIAHLPPQLDQAGCLVSFRVDGQFVLAAIPVDFPLPDWWQAPDPNQQSRLETLAAEWSVACVPDDLVAEDARITPCDNLEVAVHRCGLGVGAIQLALCEASSGSLVFLFAPALASPSAADRDEPYNDLDSAPFDEFAKSPRSAQTAGRQAAQPQPGSGLAGRATSRIERLLRVPVPIIVKLAEKKIELGQLLKLGPGAIVTFEKSCEDLLDLYVNNTLLCRGEAIKIGEKFGLKINEVGSVEERISTLINPR